MVAAGLEDELSTGLTPMVQRTSIASRGSPRRHSTPARLPRTLYHKDADPDLADQMSPINELHFLPLRQVLDGRIKRRIRRNHLSEEMNKISAERRQRAQKTKAEIERLKAELAEKDDEIHRLHDETVTIDTDRVWSLEQEVEALKRELASRTGVHQQQTPSSPGNDWTLTTTSDPFSDDSMHLDGDDGSDNGDNDQVFGEATMADLVYSTPDRRVRMSFPTPPTTSPAVAPLTPCPRFLPAPTTSDSGIQAALPDPEKQQLGQELASLQAEACKLTTTLESYSSVTSRLSDKLSPYPPLTAAEPHQEQLFADIEGRLATVLQTLSDRTAALLELNNALSDLGFPGSDAAEIVTSLSSAFRTARLELEYLTPGEVTLPLTSAGAAVLDLVLERLRHLAKKSREDDDAIDEYHSIELSLRQQLGARVSAMDTLNQEISRMEAEAREKDARAAELEVGLERLKGAVDRYTRDISELETLVQRLESDLDTSRAERQQDQAAHTEELAQRASTIAALETQLSTAVEQTAGLRAQLAEVQAAQAQALGELRAGHKAEMARLTEAQGQALALRDARVTELRLEIDRVNEALRTAHETIRELRVDNEQLVARNEELENDNVELDAEREVDNSRAKEVIDSMKAELERVVRMSEGFLAATPKRTPRRQSGVPKMDSVAVGDGDKAVVVDAVTPSTTGLLSGDLAKKGTKRRRYDSGLGFLDEEEVE